MPQDYGNSNKQLKKLLKEYEKEWYKYYWNEFVLKNENKLNWNWLSSNPNITMKIVNDNPDKPWSWWALSRNPNITWEIVNDNPDKAWHWSLLSRNPNITMENVKDNPDKPWYWNGLSRNLLTKEREIFMEKKLREHIAAFKIQTQWKRAHYNPQYELCKRRLMRECDELGIYD